MFEKLDLDCFMKLYDLLKGLGVNVNICMWKCNNSYIMVLLISMNFVLIIFW